MSEWRQIPSFPDYEVSDAGMVRRLKAKPGHSKGRPINLRIDPHGYYRTTAIGPDGRYHQLSAHVVVLEAFVGARPPKHEASHINGVQTDNRLENLRWETSSANHQRRLAHGTLQHGEKHKCSKLKVDQVIDIRQRAAAGEPKINMARQYGVSNGVVCKIVAGKAWPHTGLITAHLTNQRNEHEYRD